MNAKILQMQNKKAKLFKLKKNTDQGGGGGAAIAGKASITCGHGEILG